MNMEDSTMKKISVLPKPYQNPHPPIHQVVDGIRSIEWAAENNINVIMWIPTVKALKIRFEAYKNKRSEVTIYDIVQRRVVHFARLQQGVAAACLLAALSRKPPEPEDYVDGRRPLMKPLASVVMLATDGSVVRYD